MIPKLSIGQLPRGILVAGMGFVVVSAITLFTLSQPTTGAATSHNLLTLIQDLNGTTNQMLNHTESLHRQVQEVQEKLGQLSTQEAILQKQTQTGQSLAKALTTQEQLTAQGVSLMGQILEREKQSVQVTGQVSDQAQQLANDVAKNAFALSQLTIALNNSNQGSTTLNNQMDSLLNELRKSKETFKLFGNIKQIVPLAPNVLDSLLQQGKVDSLLPKGPLVPENSVLPPITQAPALPQTPLLPQDPGSILKVLP